MTRLAARLRKNPMMDTLLSLRGNQRACLYTEPLWGIPYNLYMPFVSVYMAALGFRQRRSAWPTPYSLGRRWCGRCSAAF